MHNTTQYYKDFKQKVLESIETINNAGVEDKTLIIKIFPETLLNMIDDIIELIETTEKGKLYLIGDMFEDIGFAEVPVRNTSKKDVYNAVQKLLELLRKLGIRN